MFRPRIICLILALGVVLFGPWVLEQSKWASDARQHRKAQIAAAPIVEQYEYERGGGIAKITSDYIYYSYKHASLDKIETWLACVDRATQTEVWYRSSNDWLNHDFIDDSVLVWWNEKSAGVFRIERWNAATGAVMNALELDGVARAVHVHPEDPNVLFIQYDGQRFACFNFDSEIPNWDIEINQSLFPDGRYKVGGVREDTWFEICQAANGANRRVSPVLLLNIDSGEVQHPLPEVAIVPVERDGNWRMLKDSNTGLSYQVKVDWDCLILKNSDGDILFESDKRRSMEVVVTGGLLIWGNENHTIYNVVDLSTGADWIFSPGFDQVLRDPSMLQVSGDYLIHGSRENVLYCRSRQTGHILWQYPLGDEKRRRSSHFMIQDDLLYGIHQNRLTIFDLGGIEVKPAN